MLFEQTFLKPGRYGSAGTWDAERIRKHLDGTKALISAGRNPPVLFEHAEPGSKDGVPQQFSDRDRKADMVKHGAGWLVDVKQAADGSGVYVLDVTDEVAGKLKDGSIKFTSPEFRPSWRDDASGQEFTNIISHVALTHKPRAIDQGKIEPAAMQFSLADYEGPVQFADDPPAKPSDDKPTVDNAPPANPDMPKDNMPSDDSRQIEAILAHLKTLGVGLPADTDESNFKDRLLTALLTLEASKAKLDAESADKGDDDDDGEQIKEQQPPQQFSLADAEAGTLPTKLLAKVICQEHAAAGQLAEKLIAAGSLSPACRDAMFSRTGATQFSAEGEYLPTFTVREVLDLIEKNPPVQFSAKDADEATHPRGQAFVKGDGSEQQFSAEPAKSIPTVEEAEAIARRIHSRTKV